MTLERLRDLTVAPLSASQRRTTLFSALDALVTNLILLSIPCELWINGSFLTEKLEPDDIELWFVIKSKRL